MKVKIFLFMLFRIDDIILIYLGIGKFEEVRVFERNFIEEIILDEYFVLKFIEEGVFFESFFKYLV